MKITSFHVASYTVGSAVDGREFAVTVPFDQFNFEDIQRCVYEAHHTVLPSMTQAEFGESLEAFIRDAIAAGQEIAPLSTVNKVVSGCEEPRKH